MSDLMRVTNWPELIDSLQPNLYRSNAYRLLGLSVGATMRQVDQRSRLIKVGMAVDSDNPLSTLYDRYRLWGCSTWLVDSDSPLSTLYDPPTPEEAEAAARHLHDPMNRFFHWLFWFWPAEGKDSAAGPDDIVALHNWTILNHARALGLEEAARRDADGGALEHEEALWGQCLFGWQSIVFREEFTASLSERAKELDDPRLTERLIDGTVSILPAAILALNARLAVRALEDGDRGRAEMHIRLVRSNFQGFDQERAAEEAVARVRDSLRQMVDEAGSDCSDTPAKLADACADLLSRAEKPLLTLDFVLPAGHPAVELHHDKVALKVLEMQIAYATATDDWRKSLDLLKTAAAVSRGEQAKGRLAENAAIVQRNLELATCWYCGEAPAEDGASITVSLNRVVERTPTWNGVNVRWEKLDVKVPRCRRCKTVLNTNRTLVGWIDVLSLIFGIHVWWAALSLVLPPEQVWKWALSISLVVDLGLFSVWLGWPFMARMFGTKARKVSDYPRLRELQAEGWQVGAKPPGV